MKPIAVLASGGLDSSILVADLARETVVHPVYVAMGLAWEEQEQHALRAFLDALRAPLVKPLATLSLDVCRLYGPTHWGVSGEGVPGAESPDEAVFLPGRNILLVGLAAVWCATHGVHAVAMGILGGNPFPDATADFFSGFSAALGLGLNQPVEVLTPYRGLSKTDLVRRFGGALPLELTLTCLHPRDGVHCGQCNKCEERRRAFRRRSARSDALCVQGN